MDINKEVASGPVVTTDLRPVVDDSPNGSNCQWLGANASGYASHMTSPSDPFAAVTVVMPGHDEQDLVEACLTAPLAAAHTVVPVPVRVLMVPDDCSDGASDAVVGTARVVDRRARHELLATTHGPRSWLLGAHRNLDLTDLESDLPA